MKYKKGVDLSGKKYGKLQVIKEVLPVNINNCGRRNRRWLTLCSCGNKHEVDQMHLTRATGGTKSCGCVGKLKKYPTKTTLHYRTLYHIWHAIKKRCYRTEDKNYRSYGARGIKLADEWHDFGRFYNDMILGYKPGLSLERRDVDGNYCKSNCTWIPHKDQAKNRRGTIWINGMCAKEACVKNGISYSTYQEWRRRYKYLTPQEVFDSLKKTRAII